MSAVHQYDEEFSAPGGLITPEQFFSSRRSRSPENRLLLQVLVLAVEDAQPGRVRASARQAGISRQAYQWIMSDDAGLMSCRMICDALDIDIDALRRRLTHLTGVRSRHTVS